MQREKCREKWWKINNTLRGKQAKVCCQVTSRKKKRRCHILLKLIGRRCQRELLNYGAGKVSITIAVIMHIIKIEKLFCKIFRKIVLNCRRLYTARQRAKYCIKKTIPISIETLRLLRS